VRCYSRRPLPPSALCGSRTERSGSRVVSLRLCVCVFLQRAVNFCLASTHTALGSSPSLAVLHITFLSISHEECLGGAAPVRRLEFVRRPLARACGGGDGGRAAPESVCVCAGADSRGGCVYIR